MDEVKYAGNIRAYMDKLEALNQSVGIHGLVWRKLIKDGLTDTLQDRLSYAGEPKEDEEFINRVHEVAERWKKRCREKKWDPATGAAKGSSGGDGSRAGKNKKRKRSSEDSSNPVEKSSSGQGKKGDKSDRPKKKPRFASREEALKGIPQMLIDKRTKENRCLRCHMDNHRWSDCRKDIVVSSSRKIAAAKSRIPEEAEKALVPAGQKAKVAGRRRAWEEVPGDESEGPSEAGGRIYEVDSEMEMD